MKSLGFSYKPRKKCYYVDGHEKPSTVEHQGKFVEKYLQNEMKMQRWIQVIEVEAKELKKMEKLQRVQDIIILMMHKYGWWNIT